MKKIIWIFFFYRNMRGECMKSCVWEQQTWVTKTKQENIVWRWRRGYLDHTGWGFNHYSSRTLWSIKNTHKNFLSRWFPELFRNKYVNLSHVDVKHKSSVQSSTFSITLKPMIKICHFDHGLDLQSCENWYITSAILCHWWSFLSIQKYVISQDLHFFWGK